MNAVEFDKLAAFERWYWWYRAQRANVVEAIRALPVPPGAKVLDAGCGTGCNLHAVADALRAKGFGMDVSPRAARVWRNAARPNCCRASINALPYAEATFEIVTSIDVLPERRVDPRRSMREMARVLRVGGRLILLAPAYQWLLSGHDRAVDSVRRFTPQQLSSMAREAELSVESVGYRFGLFFPAIAAKRLWDRIRRAGNRTSVESDLTPVPTWINEALSAIARLERHLRRFVSLPFGTTILLIARKGAT